MQKALVLLLFWRCRDVRVEVLSSFGNMQSHSLSIGFRGARPCRALPGRALACLALYCLDPLHDTHGARLGFAGRLY